MKRFVFLSLIFVVLVSSSSWAQSDGSIDFDGNGDINFTDFLLFVSAWGSADAKFDLDGSGRVDFPDFLDFVAKFQIANPGPPPAPEIDVSSTSLDFGGVDTGRSSSLTLTISNTGNLTLTVSEITSSDAQFSVSASALTIDGGRSSEVSVAFTPSSTGDQVGTLTIKSDDADERSMEVALSGRGTVSLPQAISVLTPTSGRHTMILIPEGDFPMGVDFLVDIHDLSEADPTATGEPVGSTRHTVFVSNFYIDQFEVTNEKFVSFLNNFGQNFDPTFGEFTPLINMSGQGVQVQFTNQFEVTANTLFNRPVTYVTWIGANAYCKWMGGRLPTEAEWEKAAVGTDGRPYPWGTRAPDSTYGNFTIGTAPREASTLDVGSYPRGVSPYGVHDMSGNVREWVFDWFSGEYYKVTPRENPQGPDSGTQRTVKGSDWRTLYNTIHPFDSDGGGGPIAGRRSGTGPNGSSGTIGFRCARDP